MTLSVYLVTWDEEAKPCYEGDPHQRISKKEMPVVSSSPERAIQYAKEIIKTNVISEFKAEFHKVYRPK